MNTNFGIAVLFAVFYFVGINFVFASERRHEPAPSFTLPYLISDEENQWFDFKSTNGQVVYLDFWASWCGPCRYSLPALDQLYRDYQTEGFNVVAISLDETRDEAATFITKFPVSYTLVFDSVKHLPTLFDVKGMPTGFLIDKKGNIRYQHVGFKKQDKEALRRHIVALLEE